MKARCSVHQTVYSFPRDEHANLIVSSYPNYFFFVTSFFVNLFLTDLASSLARLALWVEGENVGFSDYRDEVHPHLFKIAIDSAIQQARSANRTQQGLDATSAGVRRPPQETAAMLNEELGRGVPEPRTPGEHLSVTSPDDVRAVFQRDRFLLEEELRLFRFGGDRSSAGKCSMYFFSFDLVRAILF